MICPICGKADVWVRVTRWYLVEYPVQKDGRCNFNAGLETPLDGDGEAVVECSNCYWHASAQVEDDGRVVLLDEESEGEEGF